MRAWEAADIDTIIHLLAEDARFPMPPLPGWYLGRAAIRAFLSATSLAGDGTGRWRLLPFHANLQPGFAFYRLDEDTRSYLPFALQVLQPRGQHIAEAVTYGFPHLFQRFKLPAELASQPGAVQFK
jgi:RNA polymerase sigma-70 factor (ECF subfamily)